MCRYQLLFVWIACLSTTVRAQFSENNNLRFGYRISASGNYSEGNVNRFISISSLELSFLSTNKKFGLKSLSNYNYSTMNNKLLENNALNRNLFFYKTSNKFYPISLLWIENSLIRKFDLLVQAGAGMAYVPVRNSNDYFNIAGFFTYESKRFKGNVYNEDSYNGGSTIETSRFNLRTHGIHLLGKFPVKLNYELYYQPSLVYSNNYRFHAEVTLGMAMSKRLSITSGINYNYESVVLKDIKKGEVVVTWGLLVSNL